MTKEEALVKVKGYLTDYLSLEDADEIDEIIEALKQQPCEDCISRQAALDAIQKLNIPEDMCVFEIMSHIEVEIAILPPVAPKVEWIPVTERLPEEHKWVLCSCRASIYEVLMLTNMGWEDGYDKVYMQGFVVAWMPLPQPYKAESGMYDTN